MNKKRIEFVKRWENNGKNYEKVMKVIEFTYDENVHWYDDGDFLTYLHCLCEKNDWSWR